jgi:Methyltransferase domain
MNMPLIYKNIRHKVSKLVASVSGVTPILDYYAANEPTPQTAIDIFRGEWSSRFPPPFSGLEAGHIPLFEDPRVHWAVSKFRNVQGNSVLELGPLEGGHSYMLERAGFGAVLGIEANTRAYLKCLITKEIVGLSHTDFLCGDFVKFLRNVPDRFDVVLASGVLYHMQNPAELIELISRVTDQIFIWTHYYAPSDPGHAARFTGPHTTEHKGFSHSVFRQEYNTALRRAGFCGGPRHYSCWMTREDILACLNYFGFVDVETNFEEPSHQNGPAFALVAKKSLASKSRNESASVGSELSERSGHDVCRNI